MCSTSNSLIIEGSDLGSFYSQLKNIKDYHRRQPSGLMASDSIEIESILERGSLVSVKNLSSIFSGEERYGRFLDLYRIYDEAINIENKSLGNIDYLTFLNVFDNPKEYISDSKRSTLVYSNYLDNLLNYLKDFVERTRPISGLNEELIKNELDEIENRYKNKEMEQQSISRSDELFCPSCDKLFTNSSVFEAHFKGKKHLKAAENFNPELPSEANEKFVEKFKSDLLKRKLIEIKEKMISLYGELLKEIKEATRGNVERRQALTAEERLEAENESEEEEEKGVETGKNPVDSDNDDTLADGRIYNPLKLPLDWDGKPIPFWLWKLHGLGVPFECEICGNYVYMGRRAFDQHFYEWRHNHGMKCLGIPNTSHFFQITKIDEVKRLWEKMRTTAKTEALRSDWMEECEDSSGNVYDRRTFDDLKRQGLI